MKQIFDHSKKTLKALEANKKTLCKVIESFMNLDENNALLTESEIGEMVFAFMNLHSMVSLEHVEKESIVLFVKYVCENEVLDYNSILSLFEDMIIGQTQDESDAAGKYEKEVEEQTNAYYRGQA